MNNRKVWITPQLYLCLAVGLLVLPLKWVLAWVIATGVHELCHYVALRLCGCRVFQVGITAVGAAMDTEPMNNCKELLCALAGPAGGLLLVLLGRWFPRVAVCGCFQSVYNLLPVFPLDGGRALRCLLGRWPAMCSVLENCFLICLTALGLYAGFVWKLGPIPLFFIGILLLKNRKIPCKLGFKRVQ